MPLHLPYLVHSSYSAVQEFQGTVLRMGPVRRKSSEHTSSQLPQRGRNRMSPARREQNLRTSSINSERLCGFHAPGDPAVYVLHCVPCERAWDGIFLRNENIPAAAHKPAHRC